MAENHPGPALSVFVQGSVQTVPSIRCNRFLTYRFKRAPLVNPPRDTDISDRFPWRKEDSR